VLFHFDIWDSWAKGNSFLTVKNWLLTNVAARVWTFSITQTTYWEDGKYIQDSGRKIEGNVSTGAMLLKLITDKYVYKPVECVQLPQRSV
jgi:hypothetical protein